MAQSSLASLSNAVDTQNAATNGVIEAVNKANQEIGTLGDVRAQAIKDAADAQTVIDTAKATGELRTQQNVRRAATAIGTNMDDASELITALGMKATSDYAKAEQARTEYFKKANVGFLDNPLEFINNEFLGGLDGVSKQYSEAAMSYNSTTARLKEINELTQTSVITQKAIAETTSAAAVSAIADINAKKAVEQAATIRQQTLVHNIAGLQAINTMNGQQLDNLFKVNQARTSEAHLALAQQHLELTRKSNEIALEDRLDRIKERKAKVEEIKEVGDTVNAGRASMGLDPIPAGRAIQMMNMGGDTGTAIKRQYDIGANKQSTGKPFIAENSGKAAMVVAQSNAPLAPEAQQIKKVLLESLDNTIKNNKKIDIKNPAAVEQATKELVKAQTDTMAANIKQGDATNIYGAPSFENVIKTTPATAEIPLVKKILAPLIANGGLTETNPQIIFNIAANAVSTRQISMQEASDGIRELFQNAVTTNNVTKDYLRYGVKPQNSYITDLEITQSGTGGVRTSRDKIDLTNAAKVSNALSKYLVRIKPVDSGGSGIGGFR